MAVANLSILVKMSGGLLPPNSRAGDVEIYDNGRMLIFESDTDIVERQIDRQKVLEILQYSREAGFFQLPNIIHDSGSSPNVPDITLSIVDAMGNNTVTMTSYQRLKGEMRKSPFDLIYKKITDIAWESYTNGTQPVNNNTPSSTPQKEATSQNAGLSTPPQVAPDPQPIPVEPLPIQVEVPPLPFSAKNQDSKQGADFDLPSLDDLLKTSGLQFNEQNTSAPVTKIPSLPPLNKPQVQQTNVQGPQTLPPLPKAAPVISGNSDSIPKIPPLDAVFKQNRPNTQSAQPKQQPVSTKQQPSAQQKPNAQVQPKAQPTQTQSTQMPPQQQPKQQKQAQQVQQTADNTMIPAQPKVATIEKQLNTQKLMDRERPHPSQEEKSPEVSRQQPVIQQQKPIQENIKRQEENVKISESPRIQEVIKSRNNEEWQRNSEREQKPASFIKEERKQQATTPQTRQPVVQTATPRKPPVAWERTQEAIERLEESLHAKVLVFYAASSQVTMEDMRYLYSHLRKLGRKKSLYVIPFIQDTDSTVIWRMATLVREFCEELTVILPEESSMATTMFALAADNILMNPFGFLSPIDTAFSHTLLENSQLRDEKTVPLSEIFHASSMSVTKPSTKQKDELPQTDIGSNPFHPLITAAASRQFALTQRICTNLIKLSTKNKKTDTDVAKIVSQLTTGYPSANYPIVYFEAQTLGLPVGETNEAVNDVLWDLVKEYVYITQPVLHFQGDHKTSERQNIIVESTGRRTIHYSEILTEGQNEKVVEEHSRWRELTQQISINHSGKEATQLIWKELQLVGSSE